VRVEVQGVRVVVQEVRIVVQGVRVVVWGWGVTRDMQLPIKVAVNIMYCR